MPSCGCRCASRLAKLHRVLGNTMIYVTHDQTEALTMADRIVVLRAGRIEQIGTPLSLYQDPDNAFVAGFIGSPRMNFLSATVQAGGLLAVGGREMDSPVQTPLEPGKKLQLGLRPEHLDQAEGIGLEASVEFVEALGSTSYVHATLATGETVIAERRSSQPSTGDKITLHFAPAVGAALRRRRRTHPVSVQITSPVIARVYCAPTAGAFDRQIRSCGGFGFAAPRYRSGAPGSPPCCAPSRPLCSTGNGSGR